MAGISRRQPQEVGSNGYWLIINRTVKRYEHQDGGEVESDTLKTVFGIKFCTSCLNNGSVRPMKLTYLKVQNFRALEDIEIVCGPNASGKSTIFEAIRLVRAVRAPRLQNEAQSVLVQLQALSRCGSPRQTDVRLHFGSLHLTFLGSPSI